MVKEIHGKLKDLCRLKQQEYHNLPRNIHQHMSFPKVKVRMVELFLSYSVLMRRYKSVLGDIISDKPRKSKIRNLSVPSFSLCTFFEIKRLEIV